MYLNGWQRIQKPDGYNSPSFGMQINAKLNSKFTLNYSNFLGSDKPDSVNTFRTYHNFYSIYEPNGKTGFIAGLDIGTENNAIWYSPVFIVKRAIAKKQQWQQEQNGLMIKNNYCKQQAHKMGLM
ncbi:MAG: outer membrane beta-barrel protein [Chitinophagaceae bacterium]|nr:outer membrane beta-barrel protein [Chitinophagaceae bacterium]